MKKITTYNKLNIKIMKEEINNEAVANDNPVSKTIVNEEIEKNKMVEKVPNDNTMRNKTSDKKIEERKVLNSEKRFFSIETRLKEENGSKVIEGHAAVFNQLSEDLGGFRETINPDAFNEVLDNDVRAFFNHDPNFLLARSSSNTLRLSVDDFGLHYSFDVPDTTAGRDLLVSMERGDITQSSFAFTVEQDSWNTTSKGEIRTIEKVQRLYDVSPVSIPAYPGANDLIVAQRSLDKYNKTKTKTVVDVKPTKRNLLELKINLLKRK
tara:strand:- start:8483 stop:9280 length:798 start_codon:yes stop_codon:yes gene_type:complete